MQPESNTLCLFHTTNPADLCDLGFLTSLGSASLVRESYRDSSLSQLVPHRISLAPPLWKRREHSEQTENKNYKLMVFVSFFDKLFNKS